VSNAAFLVRFRQARQQKKLTQAAIAEALEISQSAGPRQRNAGKTSNRPGAQAVDKSALALPEPRRVRDREHVRSVAKHPCLICGRRPSDAHHLRFAQTRALGRKVSDEFTVPLCRGHHRDVHRSGDEAIWWTSAGVDPTATARALWLQTHPMVRGQVDSAL
jgi:transcriptional regulator with XRE-family HTH domain